MVFLFFQKMERMLAATKHREIHDVQQMEKMIPLIAGEFTFGQHVCELFSGVHLFDLDLWVQIDSVRQPIQRNSVGLNDHLDH